MGRLELDDHVSVCVCVCDTISVSSPSSNETPSSHSEVLAVRG